MKSYALAKALTIAGAVALLFSVCATTAPATSWRSNSGVPYSGGGSGGGGSGRSPGLKFNFGSSSIVCTGSSGTLTVAGPTGPASGPWRSAIRVTLAPTGCSGGYGVSCALNLDAVTYNGGTPTSYLGSAGRTTVGTVNVDCTFKLGPLTCVRLTGSAPGSYTNPSVLTGDLPTPVSTSTDAFYVLSATGQSIVSTVINQCSLQGGAATITDSSGGNLTLNLAPPSPQPVVWFGT